MLEEIIQQDTLYPHWRRDAALMLRVIIMELNETLNTQEKLVTKRFVKPLSNLMRILLTCFMHKLQKTKQTIGCYLFNY